MAESSTAKLKSGAATESNLPLSPAPNSTLCEVALPVPLPQTFTYSIPLNMTVEPGMRVVAPFGARRLVGVVVGCGQMPAGLNPKTIRPLQRVLDEIPALTQEFIALSRWVADYYLTPLGEVLPAFLPRAASLRNKTKLVITETGREALGPVRAGKESIVTSAERQMLERIAKRGGLSSGTLRGSEALVEKLRRRGWLAVERSVEDSVGRSPHVEAATERNAAFDKSVFPRWELSPPQQTALTRINDQMDTGDFGVLLLHGVTGSGKTEVYMRAIERALARGRSALMLVPEINLTPAMAGQFAARFGERIAVLHSGLDDRDRERVWQRVREGKSDVLIGTRSAVFAPLARPGLIIVDEEHDGSYKQEEAPRYSGRDVAIVRAKESGATVVLGSATPSVETRYHAETGKYQLLELEGRVQERPLPQTEIIDMRQELAETGKQTFLSRRMVEAISMRLQQHEQVMILMNRRGFSSFVICRSCGKTVECANCSIALTHHKRAARLLCHYCGYARPVPQVCPECQSEHIYFMGEGSEKVEAALGKHFPEARIGRLDRDTARARGSAESILASFHAHELDMLVGTQMIAKGHDIHGVTLVGVISADMGLARPDFRSAERTFQLLTQVSGRAGRGEREGIVVIQTYYPDHYAIKAAAAQDYAQFYKQEQRFRQLMHYPPFAALANVIVKSDSQETVLKLTGRLGRFFESLQEDKQKGRGWRMLGPAAAPIPKLKKAYRYHFLIKAEQRSLLRKVLIAAQDFARREKFPANALIIDVDPQSLF
ncbi:MAG: primosomal protein N' [Acidobacteria bacterium]|nr:primosomal protein N' [Acidobacteriota bacterium]